MPFIDSIMITPHVTLVRRAAELVLHYDKTLSQAARILGCSIPVVQQCVQHHLDHSPTSSEPPPPAEEPSTNAEAPFVPILLDDEHAAVPPTTIAIDILIPNGLTLRFQLPSLQDVVTPTRAQLAMLLEGINFQNVKKIRNTSGVCSHRFLTRTTRTFAKQR